MPIQTVALTRRLLRKIRSLVPDGPPSSLEFPREKWDQEYLSGQWDYMAGLPEAARYAVVAGYITYFNDASRILEIGCGPGTLMRYVRHLDFEYYHGVDISAAAIEIASAESDYRIRFTAASGTDFSDGTSYDLIVMNEALYYFEDCIAVLEHYRTMLRPGGRFIISMVVGPQSIAHWKTMDGKYPVEDAVRTTNRAGITWNCRVIAPGAATGSP